MSRRTLTVALLGALILMGLVAVIALVAVLASGVPRSDALLIVGLPVLSIAALLIFAMGVWLANRLRSPRDRRSFDDILWDVQSSWQGCSLWLIAACLLSSALVGVAAVL